MRTTATNPVDRSDKLELSLVGAIAQGDRAAFDTLFRRYHPQLFRFAFRLTSSYGLAEEVANDVLLVVWQNAASFRGGSRVSTWIFGIAYRCSLKALKRTKRKWRPIRDTDAVDAQATQRLEREDWIAYGIDRLPHKQKLTIMLVYYAGLTCEETAAITDVPVATVRTRMFHARKSMQAVLERAAVPAREKVSQ